MTLPTSNWTVGNYSIVGPTNFGSPPDTFIACHSQLQIQVCIKRIPLALFRETCIIHEVPFFCGIVHQHIMEVFEVIELGDWLHVVHPLAEANLASILVPGEPIDEARARGYFQQIVSGVGYLHLKLRIAHGCLLPDSILFDIADKIQLTDVGLNQLKKMKVDQSIHANPAFTAPEVLLGAPYELPADVWSLGILLYFMVTGVSPFVAPNVPKLFSQICQQEVTMPTNLSEELQDLIRRLLVKKPEFRIPIEQVVMHPWLQQSETTDVMAKIDSKIMDMSIDLTVIKKLQQLGIPFEVKKLRDCLMQRTNSSMSACYRILRRRQMLQKIIGKSESVEAQNTVSSHGRIASNRWQKSVSAGAVLVGQGSFRCRSVGGSTSKLDQKKPSITDG